MADIKAKREAALQRWAQLTQNRASWLEHWKELGRYMLPRSGRFDDPTEANAPNAGGKKQQHILDNTAQRSVNIATAGLLTGASSPARPWFKLKTPYDDLNLREPVRRWLSEVEKRMRDVFARSNTYRAIRQMDQELLTFGTSGSICLPDFERVLHDHPLTIGEYAIDVNEKGFVDTVYRKFGLRVGQVVQRFGYQNCSQHVRNMYDRKSLDQFVPVLHVVEPRRERNPLRVDNKNMPWTSNYFECGAQDNEQLRESGYDLFPATIPRWETRGDNVYGDSPGMMTLGDVKQLQVQQLRKSQAIDFMALPPLQIPGRQKVDLTPGAQNYFDTTGPGNQVQNLMNVNMDLQHLLADIQDVRMRIQNAFFVDMFLLIANDSRAQPATAREIAERHEEKLLMLGPVLESLHDEMLAPRVELAFAYMLRADLIPTPPSELQGVALNVQFISLLAQAQRLVGVNSIDRLLGTVATMAAVKPEIVDKIDSDNVVDIYADLLGADPKAVVANEKVALIRDQRAREQQKMAAAQLAPGIAGAARDVAEAQQISGAGQAPLTGG